MPSLDRRRFLHRAVGGAAAALPFGPPWRAFAAQRLVPALPIGDSRTPDEEFWRLVKQQFPIRPGLVLMNAANLCPTPYTVLDAQARYARDIDADASFQNRAKFDALRERVREGLAEYLGVVPAEIAITRNTSEGNNTVVGGVNLGPGDEVVIWDQNHPTANVAWDVRAERDGFTVKRVATPAAPSGAGALLEPFARALTDRTRVLAFSHISNVSGVALPARDLCALARERGIFTLVDGAQAFGAIRLNLAELGCDAYTASSHKWFVGPKEVGVLYVRRDRIADLRAADVGLGWEGALESGTARKFETLGQRDDAAVAAMGAALELHRGIGFDRVEQRVRALATALMEGLRARRPQVLFHAPAPDLRAGVIVVRTPERDPRALFQTLYAEHDIAGAPMAGEFAGIRFSPHVYNTLDEVDRGAAVLAGLL